MGKKEKQRSVPQGLWDLMTKTFKSIAELRESQKETDRQIKETDRQMEETDKKIKKFHDSVKEANGNFNNK